MNLIGYVDGQEIRFDFLPPSTFTAALPPTRSGRCIIELRAVDDAGNVAGYTAMAVLIDFDSLRFTTLEPCYLAAEQSAEDRSCRQIEGLFYVPLGGDISSRELASSYQFREAV